MTSADTNDDETRTPPESPTAIAHAFYARAGVDVPAEHVDELAAAIHRYGDMRVRDTKADAEVLELARRYDAEVAKDVAVVNLRPSIWHLVLPTLLGLAGFVAGWLVGR